MKLSQTTAFILASLAYEDWAKKYDSMKRVKEETNDKQPDWKLFHQYQLATATEELAQAKIVSDEINAFLHYLQNEG